jgi:hypothetical protein
MLAQSTVKDEHYNRLLTVHPATKSKADRSPKSWCAAAHEVAPLVRIAAHVGAVRASVL